MNFLVIKKRRNVFVALATDVANVEIFLLHVLSHVNFQLNLIEESVTTKIACKSSKVHLNMFVIFKMKLQSSFVNVVNTTDQANVGILMRVDVMLKFIEKLKI